MWAHSDRGVGGCDFTCVFYVVPLSVYAFLSLSLSGGGGGLRPVGMYE